MFALEFARITEKSAKKMVVVFAENKTRLTPAAQLVDDGLGGLIKAHLKQGRFVGSMGEMQRITLQNQPISTVLVVGVGKQDGLARKDWWGLGLRVGKQLDAMGVKEAMIALGDLAEGDKDPTTTVQAGTALIEGLHMGLYRFERYKSELKDHMQPRFQHLTVLTSTRAARFLEAAMPTTLATLAGNDLTRDCVNLPPNVANPQFMADEAKKLEALGVKVEVLDEKQLAKLGCNLILAVGGSAAVADQPRLVIMKYEGAGKDAPYTALVGKGIMFDTGGYNIKPGASMRGMKFDMGGAGAVLGTMRALAQLKPKRNIVGVMPCAMNMIGTTPFVMDSVYKAYNGLFVEIGHTDAEGRLVLADAIGYTLDKFKPIELVDLATLTGACMVALAGGYAGLFSTNNALANALAKAGDDTGERLWRLPVDDFYTSKSSVADICNDSAGGWGGASVGAAFIKKFAGKTPWAHLDIAGVANIEKGCVGTPEGLTGATGFGVRLLVNWLLGSTPSPETAPASGKARRGRPRKAAATSPATAKPRVPGPRVLGADGQPRGRGRPRKVVA